ncbi:hypothetical protein LSTR_LSTR008487 [Laodelphax striatellus]|uniref:Uncharacterized protein n=1 Tax=Laodelphax striatellus TaxID=195883 RepID=A0A482WQQ6_LAOST|nr:hypothetical protein LSTR_LSTR008487 [Laodelphax striatellus]
MRRFPCCFFEWCPVCFWPEGGARSSNLERASGKKLTFRPQRTAQGGGGRGNHTLWRRNLRRTSTTLPVPPEIIDNRQRRRVMGGRKVMYPSLFTYR